MTLDIERVRKLLRMACHPTTPVNEAHSAAKNVWRMLDGAGFGIDDLCVNQSSPMQADEELREINSGWKSAFESMSDSFQVIDNRYIESSSRYAKLQTALSEAEARIADLERDATRRIANQRQTDTGSQYVKFATVAQRAARLCGRTAWKSAVAFSIGMPIKLLNAWETTGVFPAHLVARIDALSSEDREPSSRQRWTRNEINRLKAVLRKGVSDLAAAMTLTIEFGRRIYETSITHQRRRLLKAEHWGPSTRTKRSSPLSAKAMQ